MATRETLRKRVERKLQLRIRNTYDGSETTVAGALYGVEKIDDALNDALGWMDFALKDLKDNSAWLNFTTSGTAVVYSVPQGVKHPILHLRYDINGTPIDCRRIILKNNEDRIAMREDDSFWKPSANQNFFADMESVGVDGVELFISDDVTDGKLVYYWANLEFNRMTSDSDNLSLENRLDTLLVNYSTAICLRDIEGGIYLAPAQTIFAECDKMVALWNSWRA